MICLIPFRKSPLKVTSGEPMLDDWLDGQSTDRAQIKTTLFAVSQAGVRSVVSVILPTNHGRMFS